MAAMDACNTWDGCTVVGSGAGPMLLCGIAVVSGRVEGGLIARTDRGSDACPHSRGIDRFGASRKLPNGSDHSEAETP
jgi:hypothetical protein